MTIYDAAQWFMQKNGGSIDLKKMQKLCYYTQAWSYALNDKPAFNARFEAWVHGPANPGLWQTFKDISYRGIKEDDFRKKHIVYNVVSDDEEDFLERVWATYGEMTGYQLEMQTHSEMPWIEQRKGLGQFEKSTKLIRANTMREYYRKLYVEEENT